jgi:hypothetical protein
MNLISHEFGSIGSETAILPLTGSDGQHYQDDQTTHWARAFEPGYELPKVKFDVST